MNLFFLLMKKLIDRGTINSFNSAIDIGCNTGAYTKIISDLGFKQVIGIDIDRGMIKSANNNFGITTDSRSIKYEIVDAEKLKKDRRYDFILCTEVVEHVSDHDRIVENIIETLNPGGVAIISIPNVISLPYVFTFLYYKIFGKRMSESLVNHMSFPFYRSLRMFKRKEIIVVETTGTNLIFLNVYLKRLYLSPIFPLVNRLNYWASLIWPFKYFTQFFFIVIKKIG